MKKYLFFLFFCSLFLVSKSVFACDSCMCTLARVNHEGKLSETAKPLFFDFTFEQQVWHKRDVHLARELGEEGHDTHDKTTEEFYHFGLGANLGERFSLLVELPYIVRHDLNVEPLEESDDPDAAIEDHLGEKRTSEGFGDLNITGIVKVLKKGNNFIGPLSGIKFPTGITSNKTMGEKFEPEMQPGSGSFDPSMGTAFAYQAGPVTFHGNVIYIIRTKGAQNFQFGNLFSTYVYADYLINPQSKYLNTRVGFDTTLQNEQKQKSREGKVADSGGTTWFLGPEFSVRGNSYVSIFGNFLFPVLQNLGGVHQHLQYIWNAGVKISF